MTKARKAILEAMNAQLIAALDVKAVMNDNWAEVSDEEYDNVCDSIRILEIEIAEFQQAKGKTSADTRALIQANID